MRLVAERVGEEGVGRRGSEGGLVLAAKLSGVREDCQVGEERVLAVEERRVVGVGIVPVEVGDIAAIVPVVVGDILACRRRRGLMKCPLGSWCL